MKGHCWMLRLNWHPAGSVSDYVYCLSWLAFFIVSCQPNHDIKTCNRPKVTFVAFCRQQYRVFLLKIQLQLNIQRVSLWLKIVKRSLFLTFYLSIAGKSDLVSILWCKSSSHTKVVLFIFFFIKNGAGKREKLGIIGGDVLRMRESKSIDLLRYQ